MKKNDLVFIKKSWKVKKIHFVGIGGNGMSGLALVLKNLGFEVSGSDIKKTSLTEFLEKSGIKVYYFHSKENIKNAELVVFSSAIPPSNPELVYAKSLGIPVIPRAEMLGELMRMKYSIAVSGTHGKTTTTSLIAHILEFAKKDPTVIIGGRILSMNSGAKLGKSEYLVCEADESDKSFLLLFPTISVVTNIEPEHMEHYKDLISLKNAFLEFLNKPPFFGLCIINEDDINLREMKNLIKRRVLSYGLSEKADFQIKNVNLKRNFSSFDVFHKNQKLITVKIPLLGIHNVYNATAAIIVAKELGIKDEKIKEALRSFQGIERRLEKKGERGGVIFYDDYAHHPTEIKVTLKALRQKYPNNRIIALFQPHRYTRTFYLWESFGEAFEEANIIIITEIYPANEAPIPGVSGRLIYDAVISKEKDKEVYYLETFEKIYKVIKKKMKRGDIVITLGAGNIKELCERFLKE
ncbi:MAG: UDP-N-acetylmuramate--L-alanine ligase [candidate division WOR-3 bacterium]|nr:UDP-N-acetylmuramate--L-alanine ligase [candidate division WOR-3 bacterium]MDW8113359.1 UDP-N-acetylmuramate--L-alanine ligase [candidate division WOR-3 bacterium]